MGRWLSLLLLLLLLCRVCVLAMGGNKAVVVKTQLAADSGTQTSSRPTQGLVYCSTVPPSVVPRPTRVEQTPRHTLRAREEKKKTKEPGESGESTVFETDNGREHDRNKYKSNKTHTATSE
ncbi:hypothetical protein ASPFODRAFT_35529 [Aspergillus luchuensis CBS 106.47]|uniref:Secreted protein n=1 Tax=Aspergillus luchuensis (strain CBS 106.47) TaxID=1137211 RepID=A0A1M3TBG6_ASPLC|nr:hypothetical protein ASPFODRAFT_35529 [Aspergillus luchuensis CBS 106.47]